MTVKTTTAAGHATAREQKHRQMHTDALLHNGGNRDWKCWKAAALDELMTLVQQADRMEMLRIDLRGDLDLIYRIRMPVPRRPVDGKLVIGDSALFHLAYQDEWRWTPPPGWVPLGVFEPMDVFASNAREGLRGALCLGHLLPGTTPKELVLMGYYLVTLQDFNLSELDPSGVLDTRAAAYFRDHPEYLPLTTAGLLDPWVPAKERT